MSAQDVLNTDNQAASWQLNALTEALGDLTLTVSDSLSVGRGTDNDVVLGSKEVSRNHAQLSVLNGQLYVKDLTSSNGTFVNDERIESNESTSLQVNDKLRFASFGFEVMMPMVDEAAYTDTDVVASTDTSTDIEKLSAGTASNLVADPISTSPVEPVETDQQPPVVKQTIIEEVLASSDSPVDKSVTNDSATSTSAAASITSANTVTEQETVMSNEIPKQPSAEELPVKQPVASEPMTDAPVTNDSLMHDQAAHQESVVSPEHDKTTTTALQEEADPEVLRAKQAATGQFSGTANLGAGRDLGTQGNNAMDQALDNPANAGHPDKKPSGGWFIWVFIALIIVGIALWLFNMGGA